MAEPDAELVTLPRWELDHLLAVAGIYLGAFAEDELITLPQKMMLQEVEGIVAKYEK